MKRIIALILFVAAAIPAHAQVQSACVNALGPAFTVQQRAELCEPKAFDEVFEGANRTIRSNSDTGSLFMSGGDAADAASGGRLLLYGSGNGSLPSDATLAGGSNGDVTISGSGTGSVIIGLDSTTTSKELRGASGQKRFLAWVEESVSVSGASSQTAVFGLAGYTMLGCVVRVTTAVTGATSIDVGDGTDVDRYADNLAVAVDTQSDSEDFTADPREFLTGNFQVTLTAVGSNFTGGVVKVACLQERWAGPTS